LTERRYKRLLEAAPDAILEIDSSGKIVLINSQVEKLFGYRREELLGKMVEVLIPVRFGERHPAHRAGYCAHPVIRPMGSGLDLWARRADGTEFAVDINLSPFNGESGPGVICLIRDVSDRKAVEEQVRMLNLSLEQRTRELATTNTQLENRNREVEKANRRKSNFLATMSHELRTPLNTMIGFSDLLAEETVGPLNQKQRRFVGHIKEVRGTCSPLSTIFLMSRSKQVFERSMNVLSEYCCCRSHSSSPLAAAKDRSEPSFLTRFHICGQPAD
jgi:PAS domain S-box-containing protein